MRVLLLGLCLLGAGPTPPDTTLPPTRVIVVRHAEKASETERDPVLSAAGRARAAALDSLLATDTVTAIYVTPYRRTSETASLVAARHRVTPVALNPANLASYAAQVADSARAQRGVVLIVSHSNTVPAILEALGGPRLPELCDAAYSHVFTIVPGAPTPMSRGRYGAKDAQDC